MNLLKTENYELSFGTATSRHPEGNVLRLEPLPLLTLTWEHKQKPSPFFTTTRGFTISLRWLVIEIRFTRHGGVNFTKNKS
jgi:uncharacterized protein YndB with AHSA1/START domain